MVDENERITRAAALAFEPQSDRAPRLIARGRGAFAREIVAAAETAGRPVVRDEALSEVLAALPTGAEIPENLYRAVSGIFALIYQLESNRRDSSTNAK